MMRLGFLIWFLAAIPVCADTLVSTRTIRAKEIIGPGDVAVLEQVVPGALSTPVAAIGFEARVALYEGRPIRADQIGPPALVERNQIVEIVYVARGLVIRTEGRVLNRGAAGDRLRVMNLSSRTTVTGTVATDGTIVVSPPNS